MSIGVLLGKQLARAIKGTDPELNKMYDETVEALGEASKEPKIDNVQYQGARYGYDSGDIDEDYFYVVHGGGDFDDLPSLDSKKIKGLGEKSTGSGINPLGSGTYGYLLDPTNLDEGIRAIQGSQRYSEKYGTRLGIRGLEYAKEKLDITKSSSKSFLEGFDKLTKEYKAKAAKLNKEDEFENAIMFDLKEPEIAPVSREIKELYKEFDKKRQEVTERVRNLKEEQKRSIKEKYPKYDSKGKVHVFKIKKSDAGDLASRSGLLGFPNKTRPDSPIMATEQLPVGLTEVSISKPELLERIGKLDFDADESTIKKFIKNLRKDRKTDEKDASVLLDSEDAIKKWQEDNKIPENKRQKNKELSKQAAEDLYQGNITSKEARNVISEELPITSIYTRDTMPPVPTLTEIAGSLGKKVMKHGVVGVKGFDIPAGTRVGSRLDIPAYNNYDKWVVSIHDGTNDSKGSVIGYGQAVKLKNVKFGSEPQDALDIARGKARLRGAKAGTDAEEKPMGKSTIARIYGDYVPEDPIKLREEAMRLLDDPEWTQVGMNPYRQSNFYDKSTGLPVMEASEVIQVGPLALAKGIEKPTITQLKSLATRTKDGKLRMFNQGGLMQRSTK